MSDTVESVATSSADESGVATIGDAPPTPLADSVAAQGTPVLNTLLSKPSDSNPPSNAAPQFASPQQSPVPRGPSRPESRDKYAATANAVAAGAGVPPRHPAIQGVQAAEWAQPRSPASPAGMSGAGVYPSAPETSNQGMHGGAPPPGGAPAGYPAYPPAPGYWPGQPRPGMPPAYGLPPGYPPHYGMHGQPHPAYGHPGYGGPPPHPGMHPGMRPSHMQPGPSDMVKMPPGPNPMEWAAMQRQRETNPDGVPAPSPAGPPMTEEEKFRAGGAPPPGMVPQQAAPPSAPSRKEVSIVERLVGPPTAANPPEVMPARRAFFDKLVAFCERHGEPITMIPQVSKQNVDLHRLYIAVRNKGGFEQVTKDKAWKMICCEANPDISESSAAGYQLRRHYQKHLLLLECMETGRNAEDAVAFADKLKKKKKDPAASATPGGTASTPGAAGTPTGPGSGPGSAGAPSPFPGGPPPPGYYGSPGAPPGAGWPPAGGPPQGYPGYGQHPSMRPPNMSDPSTMSEEQRAAYQRQQQAAVVGSEGAPVTPYSQPPATPAGGESRAPSAPPSAPPPATPDSSSRLSAPDTSDRPSSQASNAPPTTSATAAASGQPPAALTPTPGGTVTTVTSSAPSTSMAATPHYGQPPPMYSGTPGGVRPPMGGPGASPYPGYPPSGAYPPPPHGYPPHMQAHPQYLQHQQQMWAAQQQAAAAGRGGYPGGAQTGQQQARGPYYPQQGQAGGVTPQRAVASATVSQPAPSPGASNAQRMRGYPSAATPAGSYPPSSSTSSSAPLRAPPPMPAGAAHAGTVQPPAPAGLMMSGAFPQQSTLFPPGTVEASSISQRRRRKMFARDLIAATPRRLLMTLRSALDTEVVWAVNALTVILHDDSFTAPSLAAMPGILNAVVDHLTATLHVLWPDEFELPSSCVASSSKEEEGEHEKEKKVKAALKGSSDSVKGVVTVREKKGEKEKNGNFTKTTRTGRKVHFEEAEIPEELRRKLLEDMKEEDCRPSSSSSSSVPSSSYSTDPSDIVSGTLVNRAVARLRCNLEAASQLNQPKFRLRESCEESTSEEKMEVKEEGEEKEGEISPLFYRLPNKMECAEYPNDVELETYRPTALINRDCVLVSVTHRALALSNIVRGFSFCHGNEQTLAAHSELLKILGKFLKLCVRERLVKKVKPPKPDDSTPSSSLPSCSLLDVPDSSDALLQEVAVQLREDAFTVLAHLSVVLDLYDMDSSVSYPIMDGLVHWAVSATAEATDNLLNGVISPRDYALEALCKLCVLERNVDLLLSTGSWPKTERLVKVLARLLPMHEDSHHREFSIVILNAMCLGSDAVCWTTAVETNAIHHLLNFIEISDHNMHQVMQSHGMSALRDNPEMMGTSVGMLRRAASIIKMLTKVSDAYKIYSKYQSKLIQFTMSQLMDSRVAGMIAESLYEIQQAEVIMEEKREEEEKDEKKDREERREDEIKKENEEEEGEEKKVNGHSPTSSEGSATQDSTTSRGNKGMNGVKDKKEEEDEEDEESEDSQPVRGRKRGGCQQENGRDAKRCKGENGFPSPESLKRGKNGEMTSSTKKTLKMKESTRTENGSAMTAVA